MQEQEFLVSESLPAQPEAVTVAPKPKTDLPVVPFVRLLNNDGSFDCPYDRYYLSHKMAKLEYSKDCKGGNVVALPALLRACPECHRMFIDKNQVLGLQKAGLDIRGFDIIDSNDFPRMESYMNWHPDAIKKPAPIETAAEQPAKKIVKKAPKKVPEPPKAPVKKLTFTREEAEAAIARVAEARAKAAAAAGIVADNEEFSENEAAAES